MDDIETNYPNENKNNLQKENNVALNNDTNGNNGNKDTNGINNNNNNNNNNKGNNLNGNSDDAGSDEDTLVEVSERSSSFAEIPESWVPGRHNSTNGHGLNGSNKTSVLDGMRFIPEMLVEEEFQRERDNVKKTEEYIASVAQRIHGELRPKATGLELKVSETYSEAKSTKKVKRETEQRLSKAFKTTAHMEEEIAMHKTEVKLLKDRMDGERKVLLTTLNNQSEELAHLKQQLAGLIKKRDQ